MDNAATIRWMSLSIGTEVLSVRVWGVASETTACALAELGLSPIAELPGHDDTDVDRRAAEADLWNARRFRDQGQPRPPEIEVLFVIGAKAPELKAPPDVTLSTSSASVRETVRNPRNGYPVAWIRGFGVRPDASSFTYVDLSYPHKHVGETLDPLGNVSGAFKQVMPLQVEIALARRHREARHALALAGGPLEGLVDRTGDLVAPVDDDRFDIATLELWNRHRAGEWVGQTDSMMFFIHVAAQVCGRTMRDLSGALRRLEEKHLASANGMTLVPWLPPLDDDRPSSLADSFDLGGGTVEIYLPGDRRERCAWRIVILLDRSGAVTLEELVDLSHDPVFGPDVTDVWQLEDRLQELLGPEYPTNRPSRPAG